MDVLRKFHPDAQGAFTFYSAMKPSARTMNQGLRLDYFVCSKSLLSDDTTSTAPRVHDTWIFETDVTGQVSDHVPIAVAVALPQTQH